MSWQLGAFTILGLGLAGGFAWYERTRPNARVVALVGTLAAFAALGRIAFAALPNVKPTTDIVLISGYALGGAPGFVVGALAGLSSNFFFGQGPWTPWQMAAWGLTGLLGAGLTRVGGGRVAHRWPLALVCAAAGLAFAAFQDFGDWVTYSDHSGVQLRIYLGQGLGFDLVHAAGCLAFALAFGPALTRSLRRFAARLQVNWVRPPIGASAILGVALAAGAVGIAGAAPARAASPSSYLLGAQHRDGGFGSSPGESASALYTGWAALGLAALGHNPADVRGGGASALDYVRRGAGSLPDVGALERTILVAGAAGASPASFAGRDLVAALERHVRGDGSVAEQVNLTAFAVLALRAAGAPVSARTLPWLARQQDGDGGFSFATAGGGSDVDDTGAALEALAGAGGSARRARGRAVSFLRHQQNPDGGFPAQPGGDSNTQSTAWAVQGLIAAGVDPDALHRAGAVSPLRFIRSLIDVDGHVRYARTSDPNPVWVTAEAALALARKPLPLAPVARHRRSHRSHARRSADASSGSGSWAEALLGAPGRGGAGAAALGLAGEAGTALALVLAPVGMG